MNRPGYDTCDRGGCGVTSNLPAFPHLASCPRGTGHDPICSCLHHADLHELSPDGPRCHGCFMERLPSAHSYAPRFMSPQ